LPKILRLQLLAYIIVYPILWIISILPFRLLYALSDGIFLLLYYIIGYRKKVVRNNLKLVFPEKSEQEIKVIMKRFYSHFCDMIFESIKSLTILEKEIVKRFKVTNVEILKQYEDNRQSFILMCGHYASWEWSMSLQKHINLKGYAVYKRLRNPYFDKLVKRVRGKYNSYLIPTKEIIAKIAESQKNNELFLCGMAADQSPKLRKAFHWTNFMGVKVPCYTGSEMIAKRFDLPIVFMKIKKVKRGYYEANFSTISKNPKDYKDYDLTDKFHKLVEAQIHEAPEYYLWTHKRWKHKDKTPVRKQVTTN
jgi:KDO2-lipid IV(A) lauroyltransferase